MTNEGKIENLKPFEKGQSGNPRGRPKGSRNVTTVLAEMLASNAPDSVKHLQLIKQFLKRRKISNADAIAARLMHEAIINGESWAFKEILDRTEGKPAQNLKVNAAVVSHVMTLEEWQEEADRRLAMVNQTLEAFEPDDNE